MEGGIAILLLIVIAAIALAWTLTGGLGAALAKIAGPKHADGPRPTHRVAEPDDEHAVGYGRPGDGDQDPKAPRISRG